MIKGIRTVTDNTGDGQVQTPRDILDGQAQVMTEGKPLLCWGRGKVPYVVQPSGHYIYRTVVTICTAQWSLYLPHSGHYIYRTVVTICTASSTFSNSTFCPHSVFMSFLWISEQTAVISLYSINWLVFITEIQPFKAQWSLYVPPV